MSRLRDTEQEVQYTSNRKLNNLKRPKQSFKTIPAWNYPLLGRLIFFSL